MAYDVRVSSMPGRFDYTLTRYPAFIHASRMMENQLAAADSHPKESAAGSDANPELWVSRRRRRNGFHMTQDYQGLPADRVEKFKRGD